MNKILVEKMEQKIHDAISNKDEIKQMMGLLSSVDDSESFVFGVMVGRVYNSFYYQSKKILNREPSQEEFEEFLKFVKDRKSAMKNLR